MNKIRAYIAAILLIASPAIAKDTETPTSEADSFSVEFKVRNLISESWTITDVYVGTGDSLEDGTPAGSTVQVPKSDWSVEIYPLQGESKSAQIRVTLPGYLLAADSLVLQGRSEENQHDSRYNFCSDYYRIKSPAAQIDKDDDESGTIGGDDLLSNEGDCFSRSIVERLNHGTVNPNDPTSFHRFTTPPSGNVTPGQRERSIHRSFRRIGVDTSPLDCVSIGLCEVLMGTDAYGNPVYSGGSRCYLTHVTFTLLTDHGSTGTYGITGHCECAGPVHLTD